MLVHNYMSASEQQFIQHFFHRLQTNQNVSKDIKIIRKKYNRSVVLRYYVGFYYMKSGMAQEARQEFLDCMQLEPTFASPYFAIAPMLSANETMTLFERIFDQNTLDATKSPARRVFNIMEQMRICSILFPAYKLLNVAPSKIEEQAQKILGRIERHLDTNDPHYRYAECWMNVCFTVANAFHNVDVNKMLHYYHKGLVCPRLSHLPPLSSEEKTCMNNTQSNLLQGFLIARNYTLSVPALPMNTIERLYPCALSQGVIDVRPDRKIRIGYISPDFNKNAVGLFVTPLLKHYNTSAFEVFCFYTNSKSDIYTETFASYNVTFIDIHDMSDMECYNLIKHVHRIDILFDLIAFGHGHRMNLMCLKPAPIIINYLGYPDFAHVPAYDYRVVDNVTDPPDTELAMYYKGISYKEKLLRLPRCFINYTLFERESMPCINVQVNSESPNIMLGVMNKSMKWHPHIVQAWRTILTEFPCCMLLLKCGQDDDPEILSRLDLPRDRVKALPFTDTLAAYFNLYNTIDINLDTFPYSGTTTTCSSLLMGVPTLTIYDPKNRHVSNVSASVLNHCDEPAHYVASSIDDYVDKLRHIVRKRLLERSNATREERRSRFLAAMDPQKFMDDFETMIYQLALNSLS